VPSPHQFTIKLLRSLVREDIDLARSTLRDVSADDLRNICQLLDRWRLAGYLFSLIKNTSLVALFPDESYRILADCHAHQIKRAEKNLRLLKSIQPNMAAASIPFLSFKGLYLAHRFMGDFRHRFMWDIDILVQDTDLEKVMAVMEKMGLKFAPGFKFNPRNHFWGIHSVEAKGKFGKIDVHHNIRILPGMNFDCDLLWKNAQEFTIGHAKLLTLSDEDTLFAAVIGLGTDLQNGHHRIRKIWDVYMMLIKMDDETDWSAFFAQRKREGSLKLMINVFSFCLLLLHAEKDFPRLNQALANHKNMLLITGEPQAETIYLRSKQHIANRILFSRLLSVSPLYYWLNWAITLPIRSWHHRKIRSPRRSGS
jgi:hypothetical protein